MNLTTNEVAVLLSVFNNHYGNEGDAIWDWAHNESNKPHNLPKATVPGVIGSLVKKGLMYSMEYDRDEGVIGLTKEGLAIVREL